MSLSDIRGINAVEVFPLLSELVSFVFCLRSRSVNTTEQIRREELPLLLQDGTYFLNLFNNREWESSCKRPAADSVAQQGKVPEEKRVISS